MYTDTTGTLLGAVSFFLYVIFQSDILSHNEYGGSRCLRNVQQITQYHIQEDINPLNTELNPICQ